MMHHPSLDHWHTSQINFGTPEALQACLDELNAQLSNSESAGEINVYIEEKGVYLLEGYFDFGDFDDRFDDIVFNHVHQPTQFKVKYIFNDKDGYFGGWAAKYNNSGKEVVVISINEFFEDVM